MLTLDQPNISPMGCMEVWGGSGRSNRLFERPGLRVAVSSLSADGQAYGGGDLHLITSCASGRITRLLLADICGCGDQFANLSTHLHALMTRYVNCVRQEACVRAMFEKVVQAAEQGSFASTLLATYFSPLRKLTLCNAGHPAPLVYRAKQQHWETCVARACHGNPVAAAHESVLDQTEYQTVSTRLAVGDKLLLYSNSLAEGVDAEGNLLGGCGIQRYVQQLHAAESANLATDLLAQIKASNPQLTNLGDATVMVCEATTKGVSLRDNLLAPVRLLRGVVDRVTLA